MSVGAYLRAVGAGYQPRAVVDRDRVDAMLEINGDLGRLGGLLKLWLSDDAKLNQFDRGQVRQAILAALRRIDENQSGPARGDSASAARRGRAVIAKEVAMPRAGGSFRGLVTYLTGAAGRPSG